MKPFDDINTNNTGDSRLYSTINKFLFALLLTAGTQTIYELSKDLNKESEIQTKKNTKDKESSK